MIVLDENGHRWSVNRGDPAYEAARTCVKAGIAEPVLPLVMLIGRRQNGATDPDPLPTGEDFLRWCRLTDCLAVLAGPVV